LFGFNSSTFKKEILSKFLKAPRDDFLGSGLIEVKEVKKMILNKNVVPILIALAMVVTITFVGVTPINAQPSELWVDGDYCDGCPNDGHTWGYDAFDKIQDGIDAVASPGTVHVAAGTYFENIILKDGVQLLGGGAALTTIDGEGYGSVVTAVGIGSEGMLDGFTIRNGNAQYGGGIHIEDSQITVTHCTIINNTGTYGGGISVSGDSSPTISDNLIDSDSAFYGGGVFIWGSSASDCRPTLVSNTISGNSADTYGGGIYFENASPVIASNFISGNTTEVFEGGGICHFLPSEALIINNIIVHNTAARYGGGIGSHTNSMDGPHPTIVNNTISFNSATNGGGLWVFYSRAIIINNIISSNSEQGIYCLAPSEPTLMHNDVWNNSGGNYGGSCSDPTGTEGNISADPMFVDSENGDYHLQENSPCIDVGTNDAPELPDTDFEGDPRIVDGDNDATRTVDIGADEYLQFIEIELDIKPGSYPNSINLKSKGKVPVAVLTTDNFDAYDVDPDTCVFANANPLRWKMEDVDNDSDDDMLFHFKTRELDLTKESTEATLEGETFGGIQIIGTDSVKIVPEGKGYGKKSK